LIERSPRAEPPQERRNILTVGSGAAMTRRNSPYPKIRRIAGPVRAGRYVNPLLAAPGGARSREIPETRHCRG
jgi:hypothetical protein